MYHIVKDKKKRDALVRDNPFLQDPTLTYIYKIDLSKDVEEFLEELKSIDRLEKEHYYKSEEPTDWRVSRSLVAATFHNAVLENDKHQAVYYYSKDCHGCKKFGPFFERLAIESLVLPKQVDIEFNRINNSLNHTGPLVRSFQHTPVFSLFKKGTKNIAPYVYKQPFMTFDLLRDFYDVTSKFVPMSNGDSVFSPRLVGIHRSILNKQNPIINTILS